MPYKTAWQLIKKDWEFDKPGKLEGKNKNSKFKSKTSNKYEEVDINIQYDKKIDDFIDKDIFINDTNYFKVVDKWGI